MVFQPWVAPTSIFMPAKINGRAAREKFAPMLFTGFQA